ncbi:MFS transporter [Kitasatospora sp. NA04385]|uniref:MFS transporter n=1 Tax=Kitasatospora sp. NA04385 TaxID=2742135 RepID=UPI00159154F0|nr:MFS transporter [Kitasatospora sp. NA04385]QKW18508.1 MFS transporter [Kitasatospora sp. NA04385]
MGTTTATPVETPAPLPRTYLWWLAGTRVSTAGDAALATALGWTAAGHGGPTAGLVLTAVTVPRTLLLLLGGTVADRYGARRTALLADAAMLTVVLALAAVDRTVGSTPWTLLGFALLIGTVDAFQLPATGALPRLLVTPAQLPRALALRQAGGQSAVLLGAPLGALLVATVGPAGTALADAATFAAVLAVTLRIRPAGVSGPGRPAGGSGRSGLFAEMADGVRVARRDRVLRSALLLAGVAAAGVLPVVALLGPLLARERGWSAGAAGLSAAGQALGMLVAALVAARRGTLRRPARGAGLGLLAAALGTAALAAAPTPALAAVAAVLVGAGSSVFAVHLGPVVLAGAPASHPARVQALLTLVQSAALALANPAWGALAAASGTPAALLACALLTAGAGGTAVLAGFARAA